MPADTLFEQTSALETLEAGDGYVLYDELRDRVHFLNPTAAIVYELCKGGSSLTDIAGELSDGFGLDAPPLDEVEQCLESLEAEHLIRRLG
ncbi:PqqD family protein [Methylobacterium sp. Leaf456]|uniref:PqqD family protein n=1 Tax=Methylobacterium sp. Leaf456 TaxID=1736382 RepID=UPI0009E67D5F|nr:PqqD family protein [Methylobacterium sp. Leaf456]